MDKQQALAYLEATRQLIEKGELHFECSAIRGMDEVTDTTHSWKQYAPRPTHHLIVSFGPDQDMVQHEHRMIAHPITSIS